MINSDRIQDGRITVWTASGRLTFPEIRSKMVDLSTAGISSKVLCDLTKATMADLTNAEIEDIITRIGRKINGSINGKAAIVAHGSVDYGLARMFGTFSEIASLPVTVKVFRNVEVARQWLAPQDNG